LPNIVAVAHLQAKPGRGPDLLALFGELVPEVVRTEPETIRYEVFVPLDADQQEPLQVTVIEEYASREAADAHLNGVQRDYLPRLVELLAAPPNVVALRAADLDPKPAGA
jgi:quinol monooxygenase YgiN